MADLDVKIKIMGSRDASVDRVIEKTRKDFEELEKQASGAGSVGPGGSPGSAGAPGAGSTSSATRSVEDDAKKQVAIIELALRRQQALRAVSFREQMSFLERALVAAKGNGEEEVRILERIKQARQEAAQAGLQFTGALAAGATATATVLALVGGRALQVSAEFERMRAQLETVQGSAAAAAETFQRAVEFAAKTPFDVKGVVKATVQLEVYGQRSKEILPAVANLAAGMGKRLDDTSLVIGKALSGSLEGFESLRNEYGISSAELKKYGAVLNETGGISVRSSGDLEKAKAALLGIINTKFGGAIERQAETLGAAFERSGDAIDVLLARIGDDLAPAAKLASVAFANLVNGISGMDEGTRSAIVVGGLLTTIILGVGGASLGTVVALQALNLQLEAMAANSVAAGAASRLLTGSLNILAGAGRLALSGLSWLLTTPLGLTLTAIGVAAGALAGVFNQMEQAAKEAGDAVSNNANTFQKSANDLRFYRDLVNRAGAANGAFVGTSRDVSQTGQQIADAFEKIPAADLAREMVKAGQDSASLKKALAEIGDQGGKTRGDLFALQKVMNDFGAGQLKDGQVFGPISNQMIALTDDLAPLQAQFGKTEVSVEEFRQRIVDLQHQQQNIANDRHVVENLLSTWEKFVVPLEQSVQDAKRLQGYLKFAAAAGDIQSLENALSTLQGQLAQTAATFNQLGLGTNQQALQQRLLDPTIGEAERNAIESRLELLQEEDKLERQIEQRRLKDIDNRFAREHLAREASIREEIGNVDEKLALVTQGSDEELSLLQKRSDLEARLVEKGNKRIEEAVRSRAKSIGDSIDEIKNAAGSKSADVVAGYDVIIERLTNLRQIYKDATPEVKKFLDEQLRDATNNRAQAQLQVPKENLQSLQDVIQQMQVGSRNTVEQLQQVNNAIAVVNQARRTADVDAEGADKLLVQLGNQRLALEQQIAQQKQASAREIQSLELSAQDREIAFLEQRQAAGENVEAELTKARQKRLDMALEAIDAEQQAEAQATGDQEGSAKKAELKRKAILDEEVNRRLQGYQKETSGLAQHIQQRESLLSQAANRNNRLGGAQSPLQSFAEAFGTGNGFNFSGVEQSAFGVSSFGPRVRKVPTVEQVRRRVANEQSARLTPGRIGDDFKFHRTDKSNSNVSATFNIDGQFGKLSDPEIDKLVGRVVSRLGRHLDSRKQRRGPAPGDTFRQP